MVWIYRCLSSFLFALNNSGSFKHGPAFDMLFPVGRRSPLHRIQVSQESVSEYLAKLHPFLVERIDIPGKSLHDYLGLI